MQVTLIIRNGSYLHCVSKNASHYILINSAKNEPIVIIFGVYNPEES